MRCKEPAVYSAFDAVGERYDNLSGQYETIDVDQVGKNITEYKHYDITKMQSHSPAARLRVARAQIPAEVWCRQVDSGMVILSMKHSSATTLNTSQRRPIADTADSRSTPVMPLSLYHSETPCSCTIVAWPFMRQAGRHHQPP
jgi:hypothetical protein